MERFLKYWMKILLALLAMSAVSCGLFYPPQYYEELVTKSPPGTVSTKSFDVYLGGSYNSMACYWKNGVRTEIANYKSDIYSIKVAGQKVYLCGSTNSASLDFACYWIDSQVFVLTNIQSTAFGICVNGSTVYVAGYYDSGQGNVSCVWSNGVILYTNSTSIAYCMDVYENTVYYGGVTNSRGYYAVNNLQFMVNESSSQVKTLFYSGSSLYFGGSASSAACYWVDGNVVNLTNTASEVEGMVLDGGTVYCSGQCSSQAACWKGAECMVLTNANNYTNSYGRGIALAGTNVYIGGYCQSGTYYACYWLNGLFFDLSGGTSSMVQSVFIVEN